MTSKVLGTGRNNYSGWVGMNVTIGPSPVTVVSLGRVYGPDNTGTHVLKIVNASTGVDVAGGSVSVSMAGGTAGAFVYGTLANAITLNAGTSYYILSQEVSGGDQWYDFDSVLQTGLGAVATGRVYGTGPSYSAAASLNHVYGPVDFKYTISTPACTGPNTPFITGKTLGQSRNNYTGWVGMGITVGPTPITVTALGRIFAPGNTQIHALKIVNGGTGADVAGSSVNVSMAAGAAGSFVYGTLPTPITLTANYSYYIVSQETSGGDQWYDLNTTVLGASLATVNYPVYGGPAFVGGGAANHSYVPVDFRTACGP